MLHTRARWGLSWWLMRLRARKHLAPSAGGKPHGEPGWIPGAARVEVAADASVSLHPAGSCLGTGPEEPFPWLVPAPSGWTPARGERIGAGEGRLKEARASLGPAPKLGDGRVETERRLLSSPPAPVARPGRFPNAPSLIIHQQVLPVTSCMFFICMLNN